MTPHPHTGQGQPQLQPPQHQPQPLQAPQQPNAVPVFRPFQLDRTVTVGLIFTILAQSAAGLIWAGSAAARLSALEDQIAVNSGISERLARLEGQTSQMATSLSRIERELLREN